jgi:hypothetical protein
VKLLLLSLFIPFAVHSSTPLSLGQEPFVPAYAADQPDLTFESLYREINQFQQMLAWYAVLGNIDSKKIERDLLKQYYDQAKPLRDSGAISETEFERREYDYKVSNEMLQEMENRAQMLRLSVETSKFSVMMYGDPSKDLRKDMAQNMKESLEFQNKAQAHALEVARLTEEHRKQVMEDGAELVRQNHITKVEYAKRILAYESAKSQTKTVKSQIHVIDKAIVGINRSLERLFGGN